MKDIAIVLAAFGTTIPDALKGILNVKRVVEERLPDYKISIAFTSNFIRKRWQEIKSDPFKRAKFLTMGVPEEILDIKSILHQLGYLSDYGFRKIIVQPLHIFHGEEYSDLVNIINCLNSIKTMKGKNSPFEKIVVGRPALGTNSAAFPYKEDILRVARRLEKDYFLAKDNQAALVYVGHGNEYFQTSAYVELEYTIKKLNPEIDCYLVNIEGFPYLDDLPERLLRSKVKKVILKPFMLVAGDHAKNDIFGEEGSVKSLLNAHGVETVDIFRGLGEDDDFAEIFCENILEMLKKF
jgi:sirohydrochlorin cobaltochelatase